RRAAEHRHHGVADELLDRPAVALEHGAHLAEVAGHDRAQYLGVEPLAEAGRVRDVAEHDRHDLARSVALEGWGQGLPAVRAEARLVGILPPAVGAARHGRSLSLRRTLDSLPPHD